MTRALWLALLFLPALAQARRGDLRDAGNLFGQLPASRDGRDLHDLPELSPFASPYLTVVFPQPEGPMTERVSPAAREKESSASTAWAWPGKCWVSFRT